MINYCETCKYRYEKKNEKKCMDCSKGNLLNWEPAEESPVEAEGRKLDEKIGRILDKHGRPKPMPGAVPYYEHDYSEIPEKIRISFSDGQTAVYELRIDQPHPVIVENIRIIRKWKQGYVNQPARRIFYCLKTRTNAKERKQKWIIKSLSGQKRSFTSRADLIVKKGTMRCSDGRTTS